MDMALLAWHVGKFSLEHDDHNNIRNNELYDLRELCDDIKASMSKISMLHHNATGYASVRTNKSTVSRKRLVPQAKRSNVNKCRQIPDWRNEIQCRKCGTKETPIWRNGPAGDRTLCNVCGLIFAKRSQKGIRRRCK